MKIQSIESFVVHIPYDDNQANWGAGFWASDPDQHPGRRAGHPGDIRTEYPPIWRNRAVYPPHNEALIVRIETDEGIVGWGEAHTPVAAEITRQVIESLLKPILLGENPLNIHPLWEAMYATMRLRGHSSGYLLEAISGIDIALWDLKGKASGQPIAALLGGQLRDRVPVYASSLPRIHAEGHADALEHLAQAAADLVTRGHTAFKVKLGIDLALDCAVLRRLRETVGPGIGIAVDVNGAYDLPMARRAGQLMAEAGQILWLEEPLMPELVHDYASLAEYLDLAVAGGECLCNRWQFNQYLRAGSFDLVQPDVGRAGGISECKRISDLADTYGLPFAPHLSTGTGIYAAASLQWAAAGPNLMTCEWPLGQQAALDGILHEGFAFADGYVSVPEGPGLGIRINEDALRHYAQPVTESARS